MADDHELSRQEYSLTQSGASAIEWMSLGRGNAVEKLAVFLIDLSMIAPDAIIMTLAITRWRLPTIWDLPKRTLSQFA